MCLELIHHIHSKSMYLVPSDCGQRFSMNHARDLKIDQLSNIVEILAAEDPERTIKSKVLTDPESIPFLGKNMPNFIME